MRKTSAIVEADAGFVAQVVRCAAVLPGYATALGVTTQQLADLAADAAYLNYVWGYLSAAQDGASKWTTWKNLVRNGGTPPPDGVPLPIAFPVSVPPVGLGIEARFRALVQRLKTHANYNEAIGRDLGIEGTVLPTPDLDTVQPEFTLTQRAGRVNINWTWAGFIGAFNQCEIQVDRSDTKGFVLLTIDDTPGYTDPTAFPPAFTKWIYRLIYLIKDQRVGQWSEPQSIGVGG